MKNENKFDQGESRNRETRGTLSNTITYLLIGGGIGAAIALLFAPKSGSEFRDDIADVTRKGYDATLEGAKALKEQSANALHKVSETADSAINYAASKISTGSEVVSDVASAVTGSVADGIDRMQNESANASSTAAKAAKAS